MISGGSTAIPTPIEDVVSSHAWIPLPTTETTVPMISSSHAYHRAERRATAATVAAITRPSTVIGSVHA